VTLREKIIQEIREYSSIPFSRYMELCLYDPELGYYSRRTEQFGKAGDFYTSSDVHAVFGRLLARQFEEMWRVLGSPQQIEILELGPGRGLFAQDVLDWAEKKFPEFFAAMHYLLAERSPALRERLHETLRHRFSEGKAWLTDFPQNTRSASAQEVPIILFANEFFDALPVEVLSLQSKLHLSEKNGRFVETWEPASADELDFLDRYGVQPEHEERIDIPLIAQRYMADAAGSISRGFLIAIDYGYTREEMLAGRHRGTITAYRQHSISATPYEAPGEQDITAHVNFTALAAAAEQQQMQVQPLLTQSQFLMGIGEQNQFADAFEECRLPQERAKVALQLKHLVTPAGMGETFHVLVASKGVNAGMVAQLSGLSFGKSIRRD
jgi:SAM-dependent MidA family methyltransferase